VSAKRGAFSMVEMMVALALGLLALILALTLSHFVVQGEHRMDAESQSANELAILMDHLQWDLLRSSGTPVASALPAGNPGADLVLRVTTTAGQSPARLAEVRYHFSAESGRLMRENRELPFAKMKLASFAIEGGDHPQLLIHLEGFHGTNREVRLPLPPGFTGTGGWRTTPAYLPPSS
jgi:hypothetical protein